MNNLAQKVYEDDNGREFPAGQVDCLAPYTHHADGFYSWTCGGCGVEHRDRWWNISGRVLKCGDGRNQAFGDTQIVQGCGKMNLLVRTNCTEINTAVSGMWQQAEVAKENERLKDIVKWNEDQFRKIRADIFRLL